MTRADKLGLALCLLVPGGFFVAAGVWLVRRARARNQVVRERIEVIDLVAVRERLRRGEEQWP